MTFARACVNSPLGFPALLHLRGAEGPSFRFADEGANCAHAASAFRRTAQRRIDVADAPGAIQCRYGRPNVDVRQHITGTNDHPRPPGDGARIEISIQPKLEQEFEVQRFRRLLRRAGAAASMGAGEV